MATNDDDDLPLWAKIAVGLLGIAFVGGIVWLAADLGVEFKTSEQLIQKVANKLKGNRILVLGPSSAGKTALLLYMENGQPVQNGRGPDKTIATVVVEKEFTLNKDKLAQVSKDLAGDKPSLWASVMKEVKPSGIIYMLNPAGGNSLPTGLPSLVPSATDNYEAIIDREVNNMFSWVFDVYENNKIPLKAFHVFLNFSDKWAKSATTMRRVVRYTEDALTAKLESKPAFCGVKVKVSVTQLAPDKSEWPEVQNAIDHFGADLGYVAV